MTKVRRNCSIRLNCANRIVVLQRKSAKGRSLRLCLLREETNSCWVLKCWTLQAIDWFIEIKQCLTRDGAQYHSFWKSENLHYRLRWKNDFVLVKTSSLFSDEKTRTLQSMSSYKKKWFSAPRVSSVLLLPHGRTKNQRQPYRSKFDRSALSSC